MDQRNAGGRSRAPVTAQDGWHSYAADHIALLDHLRIDRCHLFGQCIGGSFIPNCEFIADWKSGAPLGAATVRVREFLARHTPAAA
jgi:hypothetical protein